MKRFYFIILVVLLTIFCFSSFAFGDELKLGGATTFYFAEGYTGPGFDQWLCLQNPNASTVDVEVTYMIRGGINQVRHYTVGPKTRETVKVNDAIGDGKEVSMQVCCALPIIAERPMYFNYQGKWTGGHDVIGATTLSKVWYFAEGYTGLGFDQWLCLQNPNPAPTKVNITYMFRGGGTKVQILSVGAKTRETVSVNSAIGLNKEVSMKVESDQEIIAERPMYFNYMNKWDGGHNVIGAIASSNNWYFAEGYTGPGFDQWLCLQNPNASTVDVEVTYMIRGRSNQVIHYLVGPKTRETIKVNDAIGNNYEVSMKVESDQEIIAERPMYFNYMNKWDGGHNVIGATSPSRVWHFAEGYTGYGFDQWLTIQNPYPSSVDIEVTYMIRWGANQVRHYTVGPKTRYTVKVNDDIGDWKEVSMYVCCALPIIAERPMYFNYQGKWTGGHDFLSPILRPVAIGSPHGSVPFGAKAYSPDGKLSACEVEPKDHGNIGIFDVNTGKYLKVIDTQQHPWGDYSNTLKGLAWAPDSKRIAVMYHHFGGGHISIVNIDTEKETNYLDIDQWYHYMEFSPDGTKIIAEGDIIDIN